MRFLSIQPVVQHGFTLLFFGYVSDKEWNTRPFKNADKQDNSHKSLKEIPSSDELYNVRNREWLWQRKMTTIELQFSGHGGRKLDGRAPGRSGFESFDVTVNKQNLNGCLPEEGKHRDPDGVIVNVKHN